MEENQQMTRMEAQRLVNELYASGKIDREEWSRRFDELSSNRWDAEGPVKLKETAENQQTDQ